MCSGWNNGVAVIMCLDIHLQQPSPPPSVPRPPGIEKKIRDGGAWDPRSGTLRAREIPKWTLYKQSHAGVGTWREVNMVGASHHLGICMG